MKPLLFALLVLSLLSPGAGCLGAAESAPVSQTPRYRISICDWMVLKRQKLGAFKVATEVNADGVEVDMGGLGQRPTFDSKLGDPVVREQFLQEAKQRQLAISSLAMSGFYAQSFAQRDGVERMVKDCLDTMVALGVKVAFLPLGVESDLVKHPELRGPVVERLRTVGRLAAEAGVIIGIETALDAKGEVALLDEVGSPAIKSYFNFSNAWQNGRDLHQELRILGRERIIQIHCTNADGQWLEKDPQVDLPAVKRTLDEMGWSGWLVVERSRDATRARDVKYNFSANVAYLKRVFQTTQ